MSGAILEAEWSIFRRFRRLLSDLRLETPEGLECWASGIIRDDPPAGLARPRSVHVVEPPSSRPVRLGLDGLRQRADSLVVTLQCESGSSRAEAFAAALDLREQLLEWDFEEVPIPVPSSRPPGLMSLTQDLFHDPAAALRAQGDGLAILGAPEKEGEALVVARKAHELLRAGHAPEDLMILVPRPDERAEWIAETLRAWGIPAALDFPVRAATDPSLAAVQLAMTLPSGGWDAAQAVRLLRHGRIHPEWAGAEWRTLLATAATAICESRVYRGAAAIRTAIQNASVYADGDLPDDRSISRRRRASRAVTALPIVGRLIETVEAAARPGPWSIVAERLFALAADLGLCEDPALASLRTALDDHGEIIARLGRANEVWSWSAFVDEVSAIIVELEFPPQPVGPGHIRIATADQAEGAHAKHLILANLAEGTFPSAAALGMEAGEEVNSQAAAFGREMARFLRTVNRADESLTLSFPCTDEKGQPLLPAGFLEDVDRLFTHAARASIATKIDRLEVVLPEDLAIAPSEARARAVARACLQGRTDELARLAREVVHRGPLEGTARALKLAHWRTRRSRFHRFDGRLVDPRIIARLARDFGGDRRPYSASQLESLALCPFQFFQKYVLRLEASEERREFEEDRTARGSLLHNALEKLHSTLRDVPSEEGTSIADRVERGIEGAFEAALRTEREPASEVDRGLRAIEAERMRRTARRYARQFRIYADGDGQAANCRHLEVAFGSARAEFPALQLGEPPHAVQIQGIIDRIDLVEAEGRSHFRVIDYKTGAAPATSEIDSGLALQLPLYAIAAQRVILTDESTAPLDAAYWELKKKGFKAAKVMTAMDGNVAMIEEAWDAFARRLEAYLLELVTRLRSGDFPVHPRKPDCERYCDFRFICRITQIRRARKSWPESPSLETSR